jgi:beta-1,2-mannobiose phosphorylase / 1,2-beta-oligomannan phosphorylase
MMQVTVNRENTPFRPDASRAIISFRATGEEHISSIVFRTGLLDQQNNLTIETA